MPHVKILPVIEGQKVRLYELNTAYILHQMQ